MRIAFIHMMNVLVKKSVASISLLVLLLTIPIHLAFGSSSGLDKSVTTIAKQTYKKIPDKSAVLVMDFQDLDGRTTYFGKYLADQLNIALSNLGATVLERRSIGTVLEEKKLSDIGLLDEKTVIGIGKILGAKTVMYGTVTELKSLVGVNIKIVDVEKGILHGGVNHEIRKNKEFFSLIGNLTLEEREREKRPKKSGSESDNSNKDIISTTTPKEYLSTIIGTLVYANKAVKFAYPGKSSESDMSGFFVSKISSIRNGQPYLHRAISLINPYIDNNESNHISNGAYNLKQKYELLLKKNEIEIDMCKKSLVALQSNKVNANSVELGDQLLKVGAETTALWESIMSLSAGSAHLVKEFPFQPNGSLALSASERESLVSQIDSNFPNAKIKIQGKRNCVEDAAYHIRRLLAESPLKSKSN
ncbi:MAG: hypothetical protein KCHDKBKB_01599 [Elusimicrobia bacterium]|nr:hypothetical protein [Elusimicrobiota bacterium]